MKKIWYPLILDDGGRNTSLRIAQTNDCSVRAFAIITGKPYDTVYDILAKAGRKSCQGFESDEWLQKRRGRAFGGIFKPVKITGRDDRYSMRPDLTPLNFASHHPSGRFLLETTDHVWCVLEGVHHDLWRVKQGQPLTGAWEFLKNRS
jgi:hypothetical protein